MMFKKIISKIAILTLAFPVQAFACAEGYQLTPLEFSGEVKAGESFKREISPDFYFFQKDGKQTKIPIKNKKFHTYFLLEPTGYGWWMYINSDKGDDFIYPFNLPYRFGSVQNFDGAYGDTTDSGEIREFDFVIDLTPDEIAVMDKAISSVLWPKTEEEHELGLATLGVDVGQDNTSKERKPSTSPFTKGHAKMNILEIDDLPPTADYNGQTLTRLKFHMKMDIPVKTTDCLR